MADETNDQISANVTIRHDNIGENEAQQMKKELKAIADKYGASLQYNEGAPRLINRP